MKVIAYTALLYGKDYLYYAIKSVIDHVDEYHVIYDATGKGSHGHVTNLPCPDSRWELINEASRAAGDKLRWHDAGPFRHEGEQRDSILRYAPDADAILVLDADEIWNPFLVQHAVYMAGPGAQANRARGWRMPMIHYWRSFYRCILHDPAYPVRVIYPKISGGEETFPVNVYINHMGYAQRSAVVEYKQHTHGHHNEWRRDIDWFRERFMANAQRDCHPVGSDYWNPEQVNPLDYMPDFMKDHPYFNMEVIP